MLKRAVIFMIAITLFLGVITPIGYGQVKSSILTKVEVEKLAREKLKITKDYRLAHSSLNTRDIQQRQFWHLNFEGEDKHISATIAADCGEIISVDQWDAGTYREAVTLLQDEAKKIAIKFIESLEKERFKQTEEVTAKTPTIIPYYLYENEQGHDNYYFMFVRKIKDEFFPNNYFKVTISGINGKVINYEMKWDEANYEKNQQLLNEKEARELFEKDNRLHLKYVTLNKHNPADAKNIVLTPVYIYLPKETDKIDAITGRLLLRNELYNWDYMSRAYGFGEDELLKEIANQTDSGNVAEMIPEEGVISKEKAEQIIIDILKDNVNLNNIKLKNTSYRNYYVGAKGKFWTMYWYSSEGDKYITAVVNADNGDVLEISYNKNGDNPTIEARDFYSMEDAKETVETENNNKILNLVNEKVQKMFPKTKEQLQLKIEETKSQNEVYISSFRYINNIPFEDNYIKVSVDKNTEEITRLSYKWYQIEAQKPKSILSSKEAYNIFYNKVGIEKYLVQLKDLEKYEKEGLQLPIKELLPVYAIKSFNFNYIDGATGKLLDYSGEEFKEDKKDIVKFKDIKDYIYEKEILLMDKMGVLKETDELFRPKDALLRKDALKWVIEIGWTNKAYNIDRYYKKPNENKSYFKDISKDDPYYKYIEAGVELSIINKGDYFRPNEKVSKIELTKWIINAMKQKELARYYTIFKLPYKDEIAVGAEDVGYIALAKYYNIFNDKNIENEFEPTINMERGEFVYYMYQFIKNYKDISR